MKRYYIACSAKGSTTSNNWEFPTALYKSMPFQLKNDISQILIKSNKWVCKIICVIANDSVSVHAERAAQRLPEGDSNRNTLGLLRFTPFHSQ